MGPEPDLHGVVRWRLARLARWLRDEFGVSLGRQTLGRERRRIGFRKLSARPRDHAQDPDALEAFESAWPAELAAIRTHLPEGVAIELWWQGLPRTRSGDEARVGQKNGITRRWARRGTRPRAPHDPRTQWAYIFGAICPAKGKAAALVMPHANTEAMGAHLAEISAAVDPRAHAVLVLDQAGRHRSTGLAVPQNVTLLPLPPRSPEPNPLETVWQSMRDNRLSDRVLEGYDDIVAHCCGAWNKPSSPNRRGSPPSAFRAWAHGFLIIERWYEPLNGPWDRARRRPRSGRPAEVGLASEPRGEPLRAEKGGRLGESRADAVAERAIVGLSKDERPVLFEAASQVAGAEAVGVILAGPSSRHCEAPWPSPSDGRDDLPLGGLPDALGTAYLRGGHALDQGAALRADGQEPDVGELDEGLAHGPAADVKGARPRLPRALARPEL